MKAITSIRELVSQGFYKDALSLYARLRSSGFPPCDFTFPFLLKASANQQSPSAAQMLHTHVIKTGFLNHIYTATALIDMYMKLHFPEDALEVFNEIPNRNLASFNAVVAGFSQNGCFEEALHIIKQLHARGFQPNSVTLASVLPASRCLEEGMMLHGFAMKVGCEMDAYVATAVVTMYSKCGELNLALRVFEWMSCKKVVSYNAMLYGLLQNGYPRMVFDLFRDMGTSLRESTSSVTWLSLLSACSDLSVLQFGRQIHCFLMKHELEFDAQIGTAIIDMYAKCGSPRGAYQIFIRLRDKNLITWNSMISGIFLCGQCDIAVDLFQQLESEGLEPDAATWNVMISGFSRQGNGIEAIKFFKKMLSKASVKPSLKLITSLLPACSALSDLRYGKEIHGHTVRIDFDHDTFVATALIDMYMKCGCPSHARIIFDRTDAESKDVAMWNAMIDGYGRNGDNEMALEMFYQMQKERAEPNSASFLSVISAYSHSGQVAKAQELFKMMKVEYGVNPSKEHISCMVDLLGRSGRLNEARDLIKDIPEPPSSVFASLLGACKIHCNAELGEEVAQRLAELEPWNPAPFAILSSIYAEKGRWAEVDRVWELMKNRGLRKIPGCSWLGENNNLHYTEHINKGKYCS